MNIPFRLLFISYEIDFVELISNLKNTIQLLLKWVENIDWHVMQYAFDNSNKFEAVFGLDVVKIT